MNAPARIQLGDGDDKFRETVVGGSEVSALFDANSWLTHFELWHRKNGTIATPDFGGDERIEAGIRLEGAIIDWACDKWGYRKMPTPKRLDNGRGLGGHPDQSVICPQRGEGILEVKTVDWLQAKSWGDEPPLQYQLQVMAYMGLSGVRWGDIVILVGGNELRRFEIDFRPKLYAEIERRVAAFWQSVRAGTPPPANYARDLEPIKELYGVGMDEVADLTADNLAAIAAAEYLAADEAVKAAQARKDAAQAELMDKIKTASVGLLNGFTLRTTTIKATPDREAVAGEIIKGRKGYRRLTIKEIA
ncbi:endonuclease [Novosphingobium sp. FSY-8]|uniref:Endonuclease n=1 Tax=Novosphingobium ovatum TaxID=1908523 RepID=A0ABW9XFL0_9SPHN|nr:YqaJ viral recombinase family protein [Novosphingobium ovatum]NBC37332.1 endonuclease [Novosphingobium ovatum]